MFKKSIFIFFVFCAFVLVGCASPTVVAVKKTGDSSLSCEQLKIAHSQRLGVPSLGARLGCGYVRWSIVPES